MSEDGLPCRRQPSFPPRARSQNQKANFRAVFLFSPATALRVYDTAHFTLRRATAQVNILHRKRLLRLARAGRGRGKAVFCSDFLLAWKEWFGVCLISTFCHWSSFDFMSLGCFWFMFLVDIWIAYTCVSLSAEGSKGHLFVTFQHRPANFVGGYVRY